MDQQHQASIISECLLRWISIFTRTKLTSFEQLTDGNVYLDLLKKVQHFKLIRPFQHYEKIEQSTLSNNSRQTLSHKITNMKTIGESLVRYYQTYLLKDVSSIQINYVQLCLGSNLQSIKLFLLVIGLFAQYQSNPFSLYIYDSIDQLESKDDQNTIRVLLQNTKNKMTESIISNKENESPVKQKMISTLEKYQDTIQQLQETIDKLKSAIQDEKSKNSIAENQIKQFKNQRNKLIQKAEVLQILNSKLQMNYHSFSVQNQSLIKKIQTFKKQYQKVLSDLNKKNSSYQGLKKQHSIMSSNFQALKKINEEIKNQIIQKQQFYKGQEVKYKHMKQNYNEMIKKLKQFQQKYILLQKQNDELKNKMLIQSPYGYPPDYFMNLNQSLVQSSLRYRTKNRLSSVVRNQPQNIDVVNSRQFGFQNSKYQQFIKNELSQFMVNVNENNNEENNNKVSRISRINGESNVSSGWNNKNVQQNNRQFYIKQQNLDNSIIIQDQIEQSIKCSLKQNQYKLHQQIYSLQQENFMNTWARLEHQRDLQNQLLITSVQYLLCENKKLLVQLSKYHYDEEVKEDRLQIFKKKLMKVKQIQPLNQLDEEINRMKQNMIERSNNHVPLSLMAMKKQNYDGKKQKNDYLNNNQEEFPYYQLTHF